MKRKGNREWEMGNGGQGTKTRDRRLGTGDEFFLTRQSSISTPHSLLPTPYSLLLLLLLLPFALQAQTRTDGPYLVPQTIFVGDPGRLVVPLGRAYAGVAPFVLDAPEKLPETHELWIRRIELERRGELTRLLIDFVPYAPGTLSFPALEISISGGGAEPLIFTGLEVQVASILSPSEMTLSGPIPPLSVPGTSFLIYGTIVLLIFLLFLGIGISYWGRSHFRELWERFRRRRLIRAMLKFLHCLKQECSLENDGNPGYFLSVLVGEFREFLSLFSGINCRSLTPGEFLELPLSQIALALGPVYLCWIFRSWDNLRFSGRGMEMSDLYQSLDEVERLILTLDKEEKERFLAKPLGSIGSSASQTPSLVRHEPAIGGSL